MQEFRKCIECFLCQNVCHVIRDHEENKRSFAGPRFFVRLAELEMHPLDTNDRLELIQAKAGIGLCNITKCCTEVCPEHIKITDNAIIPMKERVADRKFDPVVWLGSIIGVFNRDSELTALPWVQHCSRRWEPEPLRWLGIRGVSVALEAADSEERRLGRPSRIAAAAGKLLGG